MLWGALWQFSPRFFAEHLACSSWIGMQYIYLNQELISLSGINTSSGSAAYILSLYLDFSMVHWNKLTRVLRISQEIA